MISSAPIVSTQIPLHLDDVIFCKWEWHNFLRVFLDYDVIKARRPYSNTRLARSSCKGNDNTR